MNEERRYSLHERLETMLGATDANTLMEHLPPTTWSDLVRQRDIDVLRVAMSSDMTLLHAELRGEMNELRNELKHDMNELRAEMRGEMYELRSELKHEMNELRNELRGEMNELRSDVRRDMEELRTELLGDMASLRNDLTREMDRRFTKQVWQLITTTIGLQALTIASIGVMFANMN